MDRTTLSEDESSMRQCLSQQQKGIINSLLQSMSLPIAMIGNSFQLHAANCRDGPKIDFRISDKIELTSNKKCPAPTHPCRDPPKSEKCIEEEEEEECCDDEECCEEDDAYDDCEEEEEEDECCCLEEKEDDDCIEEEEEDCIEEEEEDCVEEEEDCVEEEEEECIEEEEEEDCIEEEEVEEDDCIEEEEEECVEEEEEEDCIEEEEEDECIEPPKPKCASPQKKSPEKETQTNEKLTEKICNGKRQICLEAPPECIEKKTEPKKEKDCKKDAKREALCKRDYKQYIECNSKNPKESQCKREPKKQADCFKKETRCKKKPLKDSDCSKEPKKKTDCKKAAKKDDCCDGDYKKETSRKKVCKKDPCCDGDFYGKETSCKKASKKDKYCDEDYEKKTSRKKSAKTDECCDEDFEKKTSRKKSAKTDECCDEDYEKEKSCKKAAKNDECCDGDYETETSRKKAAKKDACCDGDYEKKTDCKKETKKKRKCSKERKNTDCDRMPKKETNCNKECKKEPECNAASKKQSDCYAEEELKKICRKYRNYDCIPPWLGDTSKSRRPSNCDTSKRRCQAEFAQKNAYQKDTPRDCCNQGDFEEDDEDDDEECDEDEYSRPKYHPEKEGCGICERFLSKKEDKPKSSMGKKNDENYYFNKKCNERNVQTWEKCAGDNANTLRNMVKRKSQENIYNHFESKNRSLYTESNAYMHAPRFETLDDGTSKRDYRGYRNTLGTYTCPNVNNNYNGYVVQNDDVYTSQELYKASEEPNYTTDVGEATSTPLTVTVGASHCDYSVKNCSFSRICYDISEHQREDSGSSEDENEGTAFNDTIEKRDGLFDSSYSSGRDNSARSLSGYEDDSQLEEVSKKYKHYGQATAGDDDDYYTAHSKWSNYCADDGQPGFPVVSLSLDNQMYTTRIHSPVQKLARRKSPAPSMFDVEHLTIDSMSEGSNDSCVDSENEVKYKALHTDGDDRSFSSSLSQFTNNPLENLKRVIATIKKRALGIEDDIQGNVVQAKERDVNSVLNSRAEIGVLKSSNTTGDTLCDNGSSDKTRQIARNSPLNHFKPKKTPQFLVPPEKKLKKCVQLIKQTVPRHPFQSKCEIVECNNDNRPTKPHFLVSKSARTQKACRSNVSQEVINHIVEVFAQTENQDTKIENVRHSEIVLVCKNESSSQIPKVCNLNNEELLLEKSSQPLSLQSIHYVDKKASKRHANTKRVSSGTKSYRTTPSIGRSINFQKPNTEKQKLQGKKTTAKESSASARSPSRAKSDGTIKGNAFQFRQLANKKEELEKKNISEKDSKRLDFIHVSDAVAKSLPFFKSDDTSNGILESTPDEKPTLLLENLADEKVNTKANKSGFRVFKSLSRDNGECNTNVPKFLKTKVEKTPVKSGNSRSKKVDISSDMPTSSFPWRSPRVINIGPMTNGLKLYNYRKSHKRDNENTIDPIDPVPEVVSPVISVDDDDLEDFHDRIISMEMCDSAKMIRKKIRQVNYIPDRTIHETSESSNSDDEDEDERSSKSSVEEHSSSDAWYCDVPVNIVRTQELYRNQKKTNSIMDEIINLAKQQSLSDDIAKYLAEEEQTFENSDYFEENTEGRGILEASHCDQANTSPTMVNVVSEDYNTSPYNKVYAPKAKDDADGKEHLKDSETFLSFNKSIIHHIGRILTSKDQQDKNESDEDDEIVHDCESPFEVSGNGELNCNLNSLQGGEDIAGPEGNVEKSSSARSSFRSKLSPNNINVETQLRKCTFKLASPKASKMNELDNTAQIISSPLIPLIPNKLPFQGYANAILTATNKLARSNSELYLSMREKERQTSGKIQGPPKIFKNKSTFTSKPVVRRKRHNTAPLSINNDFKANNQPGLEKSSPKKSSLWSKLSRDKLVVSKSKLSFDKSGDNRKNKTDTEAIQAKTVLRDPVHSPKHSQLPTSPAASVLNEKQLQNAVTHANISKSLPHVIVKNKLTNRSRDPMPANGSSPVTDKRNDKASATNNAEMDVKKVTVSRSQSSILSNKIAATVLTPSTPKNEPKRRKTSREMQHFANRDSPRLKRKKNKIKSIVDKMEQKKIAQDAKEDPFKLIKNRSQESLRSKSGTEMMAKKLQMFKQYVEVKKVKNAIPVKEVAVIAAAVETELNLTEKGKTVRRQVSERLAERRNYGNNSRAMEWKKEASNQDVSKETTTLSTQPQETAPSNETNAEQVDFKKEVQKKVKTSITNTKLVEKAPVSTRTNDINKEENKPSAESKKEALNSSNTLTENKPEEQLSFAERRLRELRKKYQRSMVQKSTTPESSYEHIKTSSSLQKQEGKVDEPWEIRMQEMKKKNKKAFEEKLALAKVNAEEAKPVERTSLPETPPIIEDTVPKSLPERRVQEWRQKYQPSLVKRFSKTDVNKDEVKKKPQGNAKDKMAKLAKGRKSSLDERTTKRLASDSDLSKEQAKPIVRKHFRSLAKTDIFGIPQAAGKHPRVVKQIRSAHSRSRSRSTSRSNLISPKLKRKQEPPRVPYIPPTVLEMKSEPAEKKNDADKATEKTAENVAEKAKEKATEEASVEPTIAQERTRKFRGVTAFKIDRSSGKPVSIKKSAKPQDASILTSAMEAVGDAVNALKSSMPTINIQPSTMSDQKAALEQEQKENQNAANKVDGCIKPTLEDGDENKCPLSKASGLLIKREVVRLVKRDGQASYAIKRDFENCEPAREHVSASDFKLSRTITPDFNYEKKYETPNNTVKNIGAEHRAYDNWIPAPPKQINIPKPAQTEEDDYLKYAGFRQHITDANKQNPRRPVYEPKLASHKFSKTANRNEIYQKQAYKISNNEPAQTVRNNSGSVVPPTVLSAPVKSVYSEPERPKPPPKSKTPSPPASAPTAPTAPTENIIADVSKSTFGMFSKLINTITRSSVFEQAHIETDAEKTKNKNSNAIADDEPSTNFASFSVMARDHFILSEGKRDNCQMKTIQGRSSDFNNSNGLVIEFGQISFATDPLFFDRDEEVNCNNNADSYLEFKECRKMPGKMSKQSHNENLPASASTRQNSQLDNVNQIKADNVSSERLRRCYSRLESCSVSDSASLSTLNTLIEWNFVLMIVILALLIGTFAPGSLSNIFACPLPSLYNGLYNYFLGSIGIHVLFHDWSQTAGASVWKLLSSPNKPRLGVFYSLVYQVIVVSARLLFTIIFDILIPLMSIPFLVFGPLVSALMNATLCTMSTLSHWIHAMALTLVGGASGRQSPTTATLDQSVPGVRCDASADDGDELLKKLQDIQQHAGVFFYFGPHTTKKQCAYSVFTSFYLWLTNRTPAECM